MSSSRFPGKVLAPYRGQPLIRQVVSSVERALPGAPIVAVTSSDPSDDPLAVYLEHAAIPVFRGPLDDVAMRFRLAMKAYPADWVLRINGDSPAVSAVVLRAVIDAARENADLVTTTFPRTFPRGSNAELLRTKTFLAIDHDVLTGADREHVTAFYYRNPEQFRIVNVTSGDASLAAHSIAVDTVDDLRRLEELTDLELAALQGIDAAGRPS